jgi:hypothetical protein
VDEPSMVICPKATGASRHSTTRTARIVFILSS